MSMLEDKQSAFIPRLLLGQLIEQLLPEFLQHAFDGALGALTGSGDFVDLVTANAKRYDFALRRRHGFEQIVDRQVKNLKRVFVARDVCRSSLTGAFQANRALNIALGRPMIVSQVSNLIQGNYQK